MATLSSALPSKIVPLLLGPQYKPYFADRARQCREWVAEPREEDLADIEHIAGGLRV